MKKTTVDELAASMGKVIPIASSANFEIEELSTAYAVLTKNGIATAEAGTYLKGMLSEITKAGSITDTTLRELTGKGFAQLKKEGVSTTDILSMLDDTAQKNGKTLKDMFSSVEAGSAALVLASGEGKEYAEILSAMESSAGATQMAFDKMDATPAQRIGDILNRTKNNAIKLGTSLLPLAEKGMDYLDKLVDKFSDMDEAQLKSIFKWGATAAAVGPVLKLLGGGISIFTKLTPLITGSAAALTSGSSVGAGLVGGLGAVGAALAPAAPFIAGIGIAVAMGDVLRQKLQQEVVPAVDLFGDAVVRNYNEKGKLVSIQSQAISDETKKLVGDFMIASDELQKDIGAMYIGAIEITGHAVDELGKKAEGMATRINNASDGMKKQELETLTAMFSESTTLTAEQQAIILKGVEQGHIDRETKTNELKNRLLEIYGEIKDGTGQITLDQQIEINRIMDEMKDQAVKVMAESKAEQEAILGALKLSKERVNTEMVSDAVKKLEEQRKKTIDIATEEYTERLKVAERLRAEGSEKSKQLADEIIEEAERQYKGTVEAATKTKDEGLDKLDEAYGELRKNVDRETGKILTAWDKVKAWWSGTTFETKTATIVTNYDAGDGYYSEHSKYSGHFNGLDYVPYDGYRARLHKGERVLTAEENKAYSSDNSTSINIENVWNNSDSDIRNLAIEIEYLKRQKNILERA